MQLIRRLIHATIYKRNSCLLTPKRILSSELSSNEYDKISNETLESLCEYFDKVGDQTNISGFDCEYSNGVLTLRLGEKGTYVINRQPPNKQIWLSSPISGPKRYDFDEKIGNWLCGREDRTLDVLLSEELSASIGAKISVDTSNKPR